MRHQIVELNGMRCAAKFDVYANQCIVNHNTMVKAGMLMITPLVVPLFPIADGIVIYTIGLTYGHLSCDGISYGVEFLVVEDLLLSVHIGLNWLHKIPNGYKFYKCYGVERLRDFACRSPALEA